MEPTGIRTPWKPTGATDPPLLPGREIGWGWAAAGEGVGVPAGEGITKNIIILVCFYIISLTCLGVKVQTLYHRWRVGVPSGRDRKNIESEF